ncbi:MAG: hypothetical protein H7X86_01435 [Gorillibacterium sp.]|nr:hypothetical protein [Gorillibacterium sp.]
MPDNNKEKNAGQTNRMFSDLTPNETLTPAWTARSGPVTPYVPLTEDGINEELTADDPPMGENDDTHSGFNAYLAGLIAMSSVPDADDISPNSPVDPAAPLTNVFNGTDMLNGAGADDPDDSLRRNK